MIPEEGTSESVAEVIADFRKFINDSLATHGFVEYGLRMVQEFLRGHETHPENQDPVFHFVEYDHQGAIEPYARWPISEALVQLEPHGSLDQRLSQQWIVFTFTAWEDEYRRRLAEAHGCAVDDLKFPLLGDLRHLRNDVVHHRGIATSKNSGRCEVVAHWITVGEPIYVSGERAAEFARWFPWAGLASTPVTADARTVHPPVLPQPPKNHD